MSDDSPLPAPHPLFAAHFSDPIYNDIADDSAPFGSDEAADEIAEWLERGVSTDLTLQQMLAESWHPEVNLDELDFDDEPLGVIVIALGFLLLRMHGELEPQGRDAVLRALDWYKGYLGPEAVNVDKAKADLVSFMGQPKTSTTSEETEGFNPELDMSDLLANGAISRKALKAIAGPHDSTWQARLTGLTAQLTVGFDIDDDEHLKGILEALTMQFKLTAENIALITHSDVADIRAALSDPANVPVQTRYALAIRLSYLLHAVGNARP